MNIFRVVCCIAFLTATSAVFAQGSFINWESPPVSPVDITPDGNTLLVAHTADGRLEIFDITGGTALHVVSVPVGVNPVSVRARSNTEAWVVNHISDSVSIVDLTSGNVVATLDTDDEPCDVIFAGNPERAFVSCSQTNTLLVFDLQDLSLDPIRVDIFGEEPRSLAKSPDGNTVYLAVFESGNDTTILGGGIMGGGGPVAFPPNVVNDPSGPYGGVNPPPNSGTEFEPPQNGANPSPPGVGLIVRKDANGDWFDDNGGDWTNFVSGADAGDSGRPVGWDLADHDVAVIDTATLGVTYVHGLMNACMSLTVQPDGDITVIGTEATNEIRFEPNVQGTFVRVHLAIVDPQAPASPSIVDLNAHLDYTVPSVDQMTRDLAIGDPRGLVWNAAGSTGYVCGKGSNNVIIIDGSGVRTGSTPTIEVGEGPAGVALDEARDRLYVLNHFEGSISVIDTAAELELERITFFDPTPAAIVTGRKHLYDTHKNSGLGQAACASCHIDGRMDRLAWDLGDPSGEVKPFNQNCLYGIDNTCEDWHPMKGPMTTQTLQDIIGHEPLHWRGDRDGIEEFNGAFIGLQGDDTNLTDPEMQEFEDFLATIHYPPNPFRNMDNTLPTSVPLPGHFATGDFALPAGDPLPNGNAVAGLSAYRFQGLDGGLQCVTCHTLPTGTGANFNFVGVFVPIPPGPNGEAHHAVTGLDGSTNRNIKVPHLRNQYEKVGMDTTQLLNTAGFGLLHDGSVDSIARFLAEPAFSFGSDQAIANMVAFMLCFSGSDLPAGSVNDPQRPPGTPSLDTHAAVGKQITVDDFNQNVPAVIDFIADIETLFDDGAVGVVVKGIQDGIPRGYAYIGGGMYQSDRAAETIETNALRAAADDGEELTYTVVPLGTETRIGIDRDEDGFFDRDELDQCSDPADPSIFPPVPGGCSVQFDRGDCNDSGSQDISDPIFSLAANFTGGPQPTCDDACDSNDDGAHDLADALHMLAFQFQGGPLPPAPFGACGEDPTADALTCDAYTSCP